MSRQVSAIVIGVIIAVAAIYALFDERVSLRNAGLTSQVAQSPPASK
jgi:hypothetical protein